jgi:hypothetical protein
MGVVLPESAQDEMSSVDLSENSDISENYK